MLTVIPESWLKLRHYPPPHPEEVGEAHQAGQSYAVKDKWCRNSQQPASQRQGDKENDTGEGYVLLDEQGEHYRHSQYQHRLSYQCQQHADGGTLPPAAPEADKDGPVVTDDGGGTRRQNNYLGHTSGLRDKDSQGTLAGIYQPHGDPRLAAELVKGIGGTHVLVADLPDVNAPHNMPGNVGGGDGAEEITQYYYQPGHTAPLILNGAEGGTRTHKDCSGGF